MLAEELGKLKGARPAKAAGRGDDVRHETVSIASDADLAAFAARLLKAADNPKTRRDIEQGRLVFRLAGAMPNAACAATGRPATRRYLTPWRDSRHRDRLLLRAPGRQAAEGNRTVRLGKRVKLTPLARDRLSHRRIKIERTDT